MIPGLRPIGTAHLAILAAIPALAGSLAVCCRQNIQRARIIAVAAGVLLGVYQLVWYGYVVRTGGLNVQYGLPLELCDLTLWLTVISAVTLRPGVFEFAYLAGVGGSSMAILTPDLGAAWKSFEGIHFFVAHGSVIAILLFLIWSGLARPRPGCVWRVFLQLNIFAAVIGAFDVIFHANYMYLCSKPSLPSLLDLFGRWPYYVLGGEAMALMLFWLLWLPFRSGSIPRRVPLTAGGAT